MHNPESISQKSADGTPPHLKYVPQIAKGAGIVFAGTTASFGFRYLFQVIVARHVGAEIFGLFSLGLAIFSMADVIASLGMNKGVLRYIALYQRDGDRGRIKGTINTAAFLTIGGGFAIALLLIGLSHTLAHNVLHAPEVAGILRLFAIAVPFSALTIVLLSATQGLRVMKYKVYVRDLFEPVFRIVATTPLLLLGLGLLAVTYTFVVSIIFGTLASYFLFRRLFRPILGSGVAQILELGVLLTYCWPILLASCFFMMEAWLSTFMVAYFLTPEAVGIFSAAYRTSLLAQGILLSFNTMFSPIIADLHHKGEHAQLQSLMKTVTKWVFSLSFPIVLLIIIFSGEILSLFGKDFVAGTAILVVLSTGQLMNSASGPLGALIVMSGKSKISLINAFFHLLVQTGLCLILIPTYGIMGAAFAKVLSIAFLRIVLLIEVNHILHMHPFRRDILKPLIAGAVALAVLSIGRLALPQIDNSLLILLAGSLLFICAYAVTLYGMKINEEDRLVIQKIRSRLAF